MSVSWHLIYLKNTSNTGLKGRPVLLEHAAIPTTVSSVMTSWEHMSDAPVLELRDVQQDSSSLKPQGLWLSKPGQSSWAWFNGIRHARSRAERWFGTMVLTSDGIEGFPWNKHGITKIVRLDVSNRIQIDAFIARYHAQGSNHNIDWLGVSHDYGGIMFDGTQRIDPETVRCFNHRDGCWVLSMDVDSVCIWDRQAMNELNSDDTLSPGRPGFEENNKPSPARPPCTQPTGRATNRSSNQQVEQPTG